MPKINHIRIPFTEEELGQLLWENEKFVWTFLAEDTETSVEVTMYLE